MCHCETGGQRHHQHHGQDCECQSECERPSGCQCGCSAECGGRGGCCCEGGQGACCCEGGHGGFRRRFRSKAEAIAELESYLTDLKAEAQAVEERIKELRV
jgi:hypothetical protein